MAMATFAYPAPPRQGPRRRARLIVMFVVAAVAAACGVPAGGTTAPGGFSLTVAPETSVGRTIGGQPSMFLVSVSGSGGDAPVTISATAPGAAVAIDPVQLVPGVVGEVTITPEPVSTDTSLAVSIAATRSGVERIALRTLTVAPGEDGLAAEARRHLEPFVRWLGAERPELGIDQSTAWSGSPGAWVLVVEHYQYLSEDWELGLSWHVMIAPDDWSRIYLRRRGTEIRPSRAFEIPSFSSGTPPQEIQPPDVVWR
jgi:hypothetical protein